MATLILSTAGSALGGMLGGPAGAMAGRALGALAGGAIDGALANRRGATRVIEGPRLDDLDIQASREGAPVPRVFGRVRLSGHLIWATQLQEEIVVSREGGSGGGKGGKPKGPETRTYNYYANFAVGLCEGPISHISRVWADGKTLDLSNVAMRVYKGDEAQLPDSLIVGKQGAASSPAYRGLAYVVFERLPLEAFGNRLPQLSFEIIAAVGELEKKIRAVTIIPGSSEFAYAPTGVRAQSGSGAYIMQNRAGVNGESDWSTSIDELVALCPNLSRAALVTSWFGTDLRAGECAVKPGVEALSKPTLEGQWMVNGVAREDAHLVSRSDDRPAYGGTPSDWTVIEAIRDLKRRGLAVTIYPFLMMDVAAGNALLDPYGAGEQAAYPWRGRVTCHPAAGRPGSPDGTSDAASQVSAFFGTAEPFHFSVGYPETDENDEREPRQTVLYSGPDEWSWRRMVLHHAALAQAAGGVDAFLIGSEFRGLTTVRGPGGSYPAVQALRALLADVRQMLGPNTKISYAADWSEYFGHQPNDGSGDRTFHLDPLWAEPDCDFVGIDNYMPLSDWRDAIDHADEAAGSLYSADYIRANVTGGEGYDWYYASAPDRDAQLRTPITDGAHDKPWVYRYKDLASWWTQPHVNRVAGVETTQTAWQPRSKPIWFTEVGVPAVDKGGNQPNVFYDAKSSESVFPHHSTGARDDFVQRQCLETLIDTWATPGPHNPDGEMIEADATHVWTWDARPFPSYPLKAEIWSDGANWLRGHWLNGRAGQAPLRETIAALLTGAGVTQFDVSSVHGVIDGYVVDRTMPLREALEPLALAFGLEVVERNEILVFRSTASRIDQSIERERLVQTEGPLIAQRRAQDSELPTSVRLGFSDVMREHNRSAVGAMRPHRNANEASADLSIVSQSTFMGGLADAWLRDIWTGRDRFEAVLPPSLIAVEPGDTLDLIGHGAADRIKVEDARRTGAVRIEARRVALDQPLAQGFLMDEDLPVPPPAPVVDGPPETAILNLPHWRDEDADTALYMAVRAPAWPADMGVWKRGSAGYLRFATVQAPATMGETVAPFATAAPGLWDRANQLMVTLRGEAVQSLPERSVLDSANLMALETSTGWEIVQFADAQMVGVDTFRLSNLLRGRFGTEAQMDELVAPGARVVVLNDAVQAFDPGLDALGRPATLRIGRDATAANSTERTVTPLGRAARPYAPAHLRAQQTASGVAIHWVRRCRRGGDSWFLRDVPLNEASERYAVEIDHPLGTRRVETVTPEFAYTSAQMIEDFGSPPTQLTMRVAQIGDVVGDGAFASATIDLSA